MTAEIIKMPEVPSDDDFILICGKCQCRSFYAKYKGGLECTNCNEAVQPEDTDTWRSFLPDMPAEVKPDDVADVTAHRFNDEEFARRSVMKTINEYMTSKKICFLVGYNDDGFGRAWMDVRNEHQREWVMDKLDELREFTRTIEFDTENGYRTVPGKPKDDKDEPSLFDTDGS